MKADVFHLNKLQEINCSIDEGKIFMGDYFINKIALKKMSELDAAEKKAVLKSLKSRKATVVNLSEIYISDQT